MKRSRIVSGISDIRSELFRVMYAVAWTSDSALVYGTSKTNYTAVDNNMLMSSTVAVILGLSFLTRKSPISLLNGTVVPQDSKQMALDVEYHLWE
jgi:hypothetical protein